MKYKMPFSVYKRGKYYYYRTYNNDGVRTSGISTGQTSKTKAILVCQELFQKNKLIPTKEILAYDYISTFFDDNSTYLKDKENPLSERTLSSYRSSVRNHILPAVKNKKLDQINYKFLIEFRIQLKEKLSPSSAQLTLQIFNLILTQAYKFDLISSNPFSKLVNQQKSSTHKKDAFTLEEVAILFTKIKDRYKPIIILLALTGMRMSEGLGVTKDDIKESDGIIYIDLNKQLIRNKYDALKTREARIIPIIPELKNYLSSQYYSQYLVREASKIYKDFNNEDRKVTIHSLRHFFITKAAAFGIPEVKVKALAGHSIKGVTNRYINFKPDDLSEILDWQKKTLNEIFSISKKLKEQQFQASEH